MADKLTALTVKKAEPTEKAYKLADGGGLYLEVMPNGSRYWRMKYRFAGKENAWRLASFPRSRSPKHASPANLHGSFFALAKTLERSAAPQSCERASQAPIPSK